MKNVIISFILLLCFISCKKYLDKKPSDSIATPTTISDMQALLDNINVMNLTRTPSLAESITDDIFLQEPTLNSLPTDHQQAYIWGRGVYKFPNDWSTSYSPIYNTNLCLENIEKIPRTTVNQMEWDNVRGCALFFRSYYFLQLAWTYAKAYDKTSFDTDLGIVLRLTSDFNVPSKRASVKETYQQIISDAKESIVYLPDNPVHVMRPSKAAAYGLLARSYLSMRQYDSALKFSNLCLQIKSNLMDYNISGGDVIDINSSTPFKRFNAETIFYTEVANNLATYLPAIAKVDTVLYFSYIFNDLRKIAFYSPSSTTPGDPYKKFKGSYTQIDGTMFSGIATDEMYLIKAECLARGSDGISPDKDAAMTVLNILLFKRHNNTFTGLVASDVNDALNKILQERRKELIMRGIRWSDIKRLNKEGRNIGLKRLIGGQLINLPPNDDRFACMLPQDIIELSGIPQNPGW